MTKEQLLKVLKDNGIGVNKALANESVAGYPSDENAECAERVYGDLFALAEYGVQNGFKAVKKDIESLADLIAPLINGSSRTSANLIKIESDRQKISKRVGNLNRSNTMDMRNQLLNNLNDCIAAADAIIGFRSDNAALCAKLSESKNILQEIKTALEDVVDVSSKEAAQYQAQAFEILMDWRKAVSRYQCYSDTVASLNGALTAVKDWQRLTAAVGRFNRAKEDEDYYTYDQKYDDVAGIVRAADVAERTTGLRGTLADYRKQTTLLYNAEQKRASLKEMEEAYFAERDRLNGRIKEIREQNDAVLVQYQNGEIDAVQADAKCNDFEDELARCEQRLQDEKEDYEYRASGLRQDLTDAEDATRIRNRLAEEFENFVQKIEAYRMTDPAKFVLFCSRLDFDDIYDTLSGRLTEEKINEVFTNIQTITDVVERDIVAQRRNARQFVSIRNKTRENRQERLLEEQERERRAREKAETARVRTAGTVVSKNEEESSRKSMEERLRRRGLGGSPVTEQVKPKEGVDGIIHVDNEDK